MSKLWGSRFEKGTDKLADKFSYSISYDYRLAKYDVIGSIAHANMLGKCKIIPKKDATALVSGLKKIAKKIDNGTFKYDPKAEDIHTNIQQELKKLIGAPADKLHTARSRNDLIVLDMKLYCLEELMEIGQLTNNLQKSIVKFAKKNIDVIIPAYTHLQAAQVVSLGHHALAYVEMLDRDKGRILDSFNRTDHMPLGSCALSGTTLPIDRKYVGQQLGLNDITRNSIDSVSDRDFIIETLSLLAIMGTHFSRICEDMIIWTTSEFKFVEIDWSLCTGSSIMPHKKNPDICELIRGESASLISNLNELLILLKGLPLTYNRDLQLDKPPLFESVEKVVDILQLLTKLFSSLKVNKKILSKRVQDESFFSVDMMEYLIKKGASYREAHDAVGKVIKNCYDKGKSIKDLSASELAKFHKLFGIDVKKLLNPEMSVKMKKSLGSTNPKLVAEQITKWEEHLNA